MTAVEAKKTPFLPQAGRWPKAARQLEACSILGRKGPREPRPCGRETGVPLGPFWGAHVSPCVWVGRVTRNLSPHFLCMAIRTFNEVDIEAATHVNLLPTSTEGSVLRRISSTVFFYSNGRWRAPLLMSSGLKGGYRRRRECATSAGARRGSVVGPNRPLAPIVFHGFRIRVAVSSVIAVWSCRPCVNQLTHEPGRWKAPTRSISVASPKQVNSMDKTDWAATFTLHRWCIRFQRVYRPAVHPPRAIRGIGTKIQERPMGGQPGQYRIPPNDVTALVPKRHRLIDRIGTLAPGSIQKTAGRSRHSLLLAHLINSAGDAKAAGAGKQLH